MKRRYTFPILVLLTWLCNSMPGWWDWGYLYDDRRWYYIMQALCWFPLLEGFVNFYDKNDNLHAKVVRIFFWSLVSNLMDELVFDPIHLGLNEVLFFSVIFIYEFFIPKKSINGSYKP